MSVTPGTIPATPEVKGATVMSRSAWYTHPTLVLSRMSGDAGGAGFWRLADNLRRAGYPFALLTVTLPDGAHDALLLGWQVIDERLVADKAAADLIRGYCALHLAPATGAVN